MIKKETPSKEEVKNLAGSGETKGGLPVETTNSPILLRSQRIVKYHSSPDSGPTAT